MQCLFGVELSHGNRKLDMFTYLEFIYKIVKKKKTTFIRNLRNYSRKIRTMV